MRMATDAANCSSGAFATSAQNLRCTTSEWMNSRRCSTGERRSRLVVIHPLSMKTESALSLLPREFYERHPRIVARALLGKILARKLRSGEIVSGRIVEVEAYLGAKDLAAHSAVGKTPRNEVMFGPAGHCYVYFTYGMHFCANVSCDKEGHGGAVLFRALEPLEGIEQMALWRKLKLAEPPTQKDLKLLTSGP